MELTLESLGIEQEELLNRVVERLTERAMHINICDESDEEDGYNYTDGSKFAQALQAAVIARVDKAIEHIIETHIIPNAEQHIESVVLQKTNKWGEKQGEAKTFVEYITSRAEGYMTELVDREGKTKPEQSGYSNSKLDQTRITYMINRHLHSSIEQAMKDAFKNSMSTMVKALEETAKMKLESIAKTFKVSASVAR